jgi:hypothetical protein
MLASVVALLGDAMLATAAELRLFRNWRFHLAHRDGLRRRKVFVKMECYSCHTVAGKRFGDPAQNPVVNLVELLKGIR